jgi:hypothetical protein
MMQEHIVKQVDNNIALYTIHWSPLRKADKYDIVKTVPSMSGIFELYYQDRKNKLNLLLFSKVWYGGLKHELRKFTDAEMEQDEKRRHILNNYDCYYRYALTNSYHDMCDIFYYFSRTYTPHNSPPPHSGRYKDIIINEISKDKLVTI